MAPAIAGASMVIAIDMVDSKLELAKAVGATHTINARSGNAVGEVIELTKGGCDYTFEAIWFKSHGRASLSNVVQRRHRNHYRDDSGWHDG